MQWKAAAAEAYEQLAQAPASCTSWEATSTGGLERQQLQINAMDSLATV
jgi:hypothetical protein